MGMSNYYFNIIICIRYVYLILYDGMVRGVNDVIVK